MGVEMAERIARLETLEKEHSAQAEKRDTQISAIFKALRELTGTVQIEMTLRKIERENQLRQSARDRRLVKWVLAAAGALWTVGQAIFLGHQS